MTNKEIIDRAIEQAGKNGFLLGQMGKKILDEGGVETVIFSHLFAESFWGDELLCYDCGEPVGQPMTVMDGAVQIGTGECSCSRQFENNEPAWEYHLKQMVVAGNPFEYLRQYLKVAQ